MQNYTPLFSGIVESSLWVEDDIVVKVFLTMLAKKDRDHVVRGSAFNIAQWSHKSEREVLDALKVLAAPDRKRVEPQPFEGRRVEKTEDGWLILNGEKYQREMQRMNRREYQRNWQRDNREKKKAGANGETVRRSKLMKGEAGFVAAKGDERLEDLAVASSMPDTAADEEAAAIREQEIARAEAAAVAAAAGALPPETPPALI